MTTQISAVRGETATIWILDYHDKWLKEQKKFQHHLSMKEFQFIISILVQTRFKSIFTSENGSFSISSFSIMSNLINFFLSFWSSYRKFQILMFKKNNNNQSKSLTEIHFNQLNSFSFTYRDNLNFVVIRWSCNR